MATKAKAVLFKEWFNTRKTVDEDTRIVPSKIQGTGF